MLCRQLTSSSASVLRDLLPGCISDGWVARALFHAGSGPSTSTSSSSHAPLMQLKSANQASCTSCSRSWDPQPYYRNHQHHQPHPLGFSSQFSLGMACTAWSLHHVRYLRTPPYSQQSGRPKPKPWPAFEKIKAMQDNAMSFKWHRTVIRIPAEVAVGLHNGVLSLSGKAGSLQLYLSDLDPTGLIGFRFVGQPAAVSSSAGASPHASSSEIAASSSSSNATSSSSSSSSSVGGLMLLASPDLERFDAASSAIHNAIQGVTQGFMVGLTVKGVGYRFEPVEGPVAKRSWYFEKEDGGKTPVTYPYNKPAQAIRLKVGYSRPAIFPLPPAVYAFFVKPTLLYLYGLQLDQLEKLAQAIRKIRKPNAYTGNGVQLVGETIKLKQRSGSK